MELFYHLWNQTGSSIQDVKKIVLLHGMGGTGSLWRPIGATLESQWAVLALDQRGHGRSQIPATPGGRTQPGYTPLDYGKDIVETLTTLSFSPTWVLGHSMGVRTTVAAAHLQPTLFQGMILVDLGFSGVAGGGLGEGLANFIKILPQKFSSRDAAKSFMAMNCPDPSIAQYLLAVSQKDPDGSLSFPFDHSALIQTIHSARDVSVRGWIRDLAEKGMPILILRGARSLVWSHSDYEKEKETFSDLKNVSFQEVEGAGHGLPFEKRAEFLAAVIEFTS